MPKASSKSKQNRPWKKVVREAQQYRDASIARSLSTDAKFPDVLPKYVFDLLRINLSDECARITNAMPERLLLDLKDGRLTATAVTTAFLRRAALSQKLVRVGDFIPASCVNIYL